MSDGPGNPYSLVISAPSGAGKTSLAAELLKRIEGLERVITCTTRPQRPGEEHGRDYFFVQPGEFDRQRGRGDLVEWAEVHGNYYGTPRSELERIHGLGHDAVLVIDVQGAESMRRLQRNVVSVFVLPPSPEVLEQRLTRRDDDDPVSRDGVESRLAIARHEIVHFVGYDYVIVNDDFETAVTDLVAIVRAERCRRDRMARTAKKIMSSFGDTRAESRELHSSGSEGK